MSTSWYIGYSFILIFLGVIIGYSICALLVVASDEDHALHAYDQGYQKALQDHKKPQFITLDKDR